MTSIITPTFVMDLKTRVQDIANEDYQRLKQDIWWNKIATTLNSTTKKERLSWLLSTGTLEEVAHDGGEVANDTLLRASTEFENKFVRKGLKVKFEEFEDLDGGAVMLAGGRVAGRAGFDSISKWTRDIAAHAAYWPQQKLAEAMIANPTAYDQVAFFATNHLVNPLDAGFGTFANDFTGAASGSYPGALPIHDVGAGSVTAEVALQNLARAIAYIRGFIKMPNGVLLRKLRVTGIMVPPELAARATQLTSAKFIAQSAASGALSGDVEGIISYLNLGVPIIADELGAASGGSATTYYLIVQELSSPQMGAFIYSNREPIQITYVGPETDAELARSRELQWIAQGRNTVAPGHPFQLFRCRAT